MNRLVKMHSVSLFLLFPLQQRGVQRITAQSPRNSSNFLQGRRNDLKVHVVPTGSPRAFIGGVIALHEAMSTDHFSMLGSVAMDHVCFMPGRGWRGKKVFHGVFFFLALAFANRKFMPGFKTCGRGVFICWPLKWRTVDLTDPAAGFMGYAAATRNTTGVMISFLPLQRGAALCLSRSREHHTGGLPSVDPPGLFLLCCVVNADDADNPQDETKKEIRSALAGLVDLCLFAPNPGRL